MKIIHLSDLHFGTEKSDVLTLLMQNIEAVRPDMIIVSGDFTQIASTSEFQVARAFIDALPAPVFCVPGNHDVPRYALRERFFEPYKKYQQFIHEELCPVFENDAVVIAGLNSARRALLHWNWANGAISAAQLEKLKSVYGLHKTKPRICVFHHPIHEALNAPMNTVVFGARQALSTLNELKVDLVLTGHVHHASITTLGDADHTTTYISASTALSSRLRKQQNGFNVIEINKDELNAELFAFDGLRFDVIEKFSKRL